MNHPVLMEPVDHTETTILETLDIHAVVNEDSQEDTAIQVSRHWNICFQYSML